MMKLDVVRKKLGNGLTVVVVDTPHLHSAIASIHLRVGSRHETSRTNGVSHLLEHLVFRGTKAFPNSVDMNIAVEAVGGNLNAATMRDTTMFYTPLHPSGVTVALEVLGEMVTRPLLENLATEKKVVLEEMLDEVDERGRDIDVDNLTKRAQFGPHPLSLKIAGTRQSVRRLSDHDVRAHWRRFFTGGNAVLSVVGPVRARDVLKVAEKSLAALPRGRRSEERSPKAHSNGPRFVYVVHEESQVEFRVAFRTVPEDHPDTLALHLLRRILDDGLSSRLPHRIVEEQGLAYSILANIETYHDAGSFDIDAACTSANVPRVLHEISDTLRAVQSGDVRQAELDLAQHRYGMHMQFLLDSPADVSGWFGHAELFHRAETLEQRLARVRAVTLEQVIEAARRWLVPQRLTAVGVGPIDARAAMRDAIKRWSGDPERRR